MSILFIHCRKGMFSLTICQSCGHMWECANCSAKLTTYAIGLNKQLICNQCQTSYTYPKNCPECGSQEILSKFGGIEELVLILEKDFGKSVIRYDKDVKKCQPITGNSVAVSTRVFDPNIDYFLFDKIVFLQAENLLASSDYLNQEEVLKALCEVFLASSGEIIFDTKSPNLEFFESIMELNKNLQNLENQTENSENNHQNKIENIENQKNPNINLQLSSELFEEIYKEKLAKNIEFSQQNEQQNIVKIDNSQNLQSPESQENQEKIQNRTEIIYNWYNSNLTIEAKNRENFRFPPFTNLLLITTQEKSTSQSLESLESITNYLKTLQKELPEITFGKPYPARFLKRKNKFSHHILVRYPRQYTQFARLKTVISWLSDKYKVQIRLNPSHLF